MNEPAWLTREVVLAVHDILLERFGGAAGVRDHGLLESALERLRQLHAYGTPPPTLFELAAAYAHGIVRNHPFIDGNKRAGFMAAYVFLGANNRELCAPEEQVVEQTLALAAGTLPAADYAAWLARSCRPATS